VNARLKHLVDMRGIGLVTGDSGSGNHHVPQPRGDLHAGLYRVLYVSMATGNVMDMYKSIAWELGLPTERNRAGLFKQIRAEVSRLCAENRLRPVLIIDEAHHLRTELLEDLRLLTNYAMDSENRLSVVLVGHPELRRRMGMAALDALSQRIVVRTNVRGLARDEMGPYLANRLRLAGCELPLFETPAIEPLFQAASGLPRKANALAHHAPLRRSHPEGQVHQHRARPGCHARSGLSTRPRWPLAFWHTVRRAEAITQASRPALTLKLLRERHPRGSIADDAVVIFFCRASAKSHTAPRQLRG
jgi:general secretion pathway protein A